MRRILVVASSFLLLAGCALRPRYADFVSPATPGDTVTLRLTEKDSGKPLAGVAVEVGELKSRVRVTTGADGTFSLPVDPRLLADNPVILVTLPRGVSGYDLAIVTAPGPSAPQAPRAPETAAPPAPAAPPANG